jgi:hypothetical protein
MLTVRPGSRLVTTPPKALPAGHPLRGFSNPGLWMAHCHIAEHNQSEMMFSFPRLRYGRGVIMQIALALYPRFTVLDIIGPFQPIGDSEAPSSLASIGPGDTLVTSDFSGNIRLVDLSSRTQVGPPMVGRAVAVSTVEVLPGGRELIAGFYGTSGEAQLFDIAKGQRIGDPFPSLGPFGAVAVSPDGNTLVTGDGARMMRWDIDSDHWRTTACAVAGRNLTRVEWAQYLSNGGRYRATCPEHTAAPR